MGFPQAVRATAYLVLACLVIANVLMRNNPAVYDLRAKAPPPNILGLLSDVPYIMSILGCVDQQLITLSDLAEMATAASSPSLVSTSQVHSTCSYSIISKLFLVLVFYLQLYAIQHGVGQTIAFYSVLFLH